MSLQDVKMTLQDVKMTLQSHILKAARILGCTAFCIYDQDTPPKKHSDQILDAELVGWPLPTPRE